MQEFNYRQEFPLFISFYYQNGKGELKPFGFPPFSFKIFFWTTSRSEAYVASCTYVHGEPRFQNCKKFEDKLVVVFDRHNLSPGDLHSEMVMDVPSDLYPDGLRRDVLLIHPEVKLIHGPTPSPSLAQINAVLPYIMGKNGIDGKDGKDGVDGKDGADGKDGKDFTFEDMTEEQKETLAQQMADKALGDIDGKVEEAIKRKLEEMPEAGIPEDLGDDFFEGLFKDEAIMQRNIYNL